MRMRAILTALALVAAPAMLAPTAAYADGIERPQRPRRVRRPPPPPAPPAPVPPPVVDAGPETVTLSNSFFASSGGVGADIGVGGYYSSTTVIIRGSSASASAFAYASARSGASARGGSWGRGGHGCGCR